MLLVSAVVFLRGKSFKIEVSDLQILSTRHACILGTCVSHSSCLSLGDARERRGCAPKKKKASAKMIIGDGNVFWQIPEDLR